jgi:hypothetical protein
VINVAAIKGERFTGFEKADGKGPFNCGNCHYFDRGGCSQKDMVRYSKQPSLPNGLISVGRDDCCEYVDRTGKNWRSDASSDQEYGDGFNEMMNRRLSTR